VFIVESADGAALRRHTPFDQDRKEQGFFPTVMALVGINAQKLHHRPKLWNVEPPPLIQGHCGILQGFDNGLDDAVFG
jgi:hypothetical protein